MVSMSLCLKQMVIRKSLGWLEWNLYKSSSSLFKKKKIMEKWFLNGILVFTCLTWMKLILMEYISKRGKPLDIWILRSNLLFLSIVNKQLSFEIVSFHKLKHIYTAVKLAIIVHVLSFPSIILVFWTLEIYIQCIYVLSQKMCSAQLRVTQAWLCKFDVR